MTQTKQISTRMTPFTAWHTYRVRTQQKRKALQMLALSGVVRPGAVELRYTIPLLKIGALSSPSDTRPSHDVNPVPHLQPLAANMHARGKQLFQWLRRGLTAPLF